MDIKRLSVDYGLFLSVVIVIFIVAFLLVFGSRGMWERGLGKQVAQEMEKSFPQEYLVGDSVAVESSLATSLAVYRMLPASSSSNEDLAVYGVVVRVPTLYGPMAAVYRYIPDGDAEFVGIVGFKREASKERDIVETLRNSIQITRWQERIPAVISTYIMQANDGGEE